MTFKPPDLDKLELRRKLRASVTLQEAKLWKYLKSGQSGVSFRKQHSIGNYIVDFACIARKLVIEIDGSDHFDRLLEDKIRQEYLESQGWKVIRFWNNQIVYNIEDVVHTIENILRNEE